MEELEAKNEARGGDEEDWRVQGEGDGGRTTAVEMRRKIGVLNINGGW